MTKNVNVQNTSLMMTPKYSTGNKILTVKAKFSSPPCKEKSQEMQNLETYCVVGAPLHQRALR